jgi:hypothetical protein
VSGTAQGGTGGLGILAFGGNGDAVGTPNGNGGTAIFGNGGNGGNTATSTGGDGVSGQGGGGFTVAGNGVTGTGGQNLSPGGGNGGNGVVALGGTGTGTSNGGTGIVATGGDPGTGTVLGQAGLFQGNVIIVPFISLAGASGNGDLTVNGSISCNGLTNSGLKTFKIDHPVDPENKFLVHSSVESPDMMNVYNGEVVLDAKGEATVELPSYFEVLNKDFRYQLTCIGGFAPVYVAEKIHENRFKIAGGREGLEVSWQVTGIRQDAYANAHRVRPEVEKSSSEKGKFLHPVELGRPESCKIGATTTIAGTSAPARPEIPARPEPAKVSKHD